MTATASKPISIKNLTTAFTLGAMAEQRWTNVTRLITLRSLPVESWRSSVPNPSYDVDFPKMERDSLVLPSDGALTHGAVLSDDGQVSIPLMVIHRPEGGQSRTFVAWKLIFRAHEDNSVELAPQLDSVQLAKFSGPTHSLVMQPEQLNAMLGAVVGCGIHPGRLISVLSGIGMLVESDPRIRGLRYAEIAELTLVQGVLAQALMKAKPWAQD